MTDKQRKVPCPNCKEMNVNCACMRNKCLHCGKPVGNITFAACDDCWDKGRSVGRYRKMSEKEIKPYDEAVRLLRWRRSPLFGGEGTDKDGKRYNTITDWDSEVDAFLIRIDKGGVE